MAEVFRDFLDFLVGFFDKSVFFGRDLHIVNGDGYRPESRVFIPLSLDVVENDGGLGYPVDSYAPVDYLPEFFFRYDKRYFKIEDLVVIGPVYKVEILGYRSVKDYSSDRGVMTKKMLK